MSADLLSERDDLPTMKTRPSAVAGFALVSLVALAFVAATFVRNPVDSSVVSDDGAYALEVVSLLDGGGWSVPHVLAPVDPHGLAYPYESSRVSAKGYFPSGRHVLWAAARLSPCPLPRRSWTPTTPGHGADCHDRAHRIAVHGGGPSGISSRSDVSCSDVATPLQFATALGPHSYGGGDCTLGVWRPPLDEGSSFTSLATSCLRGRCECLGCEVRVCCSSSPPQSWWLGRAYT